MSLKTILKNIYSFLEVLQSARSPDVETWDQQALENALQWATYCEQVYTQAQCKPYREDLNQQVKQLGKLPLKLGDLEINLELLRKATPVLIKSLVQNPQLSDQLLSRILSVGNDGSSACDILSLLSELSETKSSLQQAMQLKELVNSAQQSGEIDQHWRSTSVQTQACLLLRHIRKVWINCHRRDKAVSHTEIILTSALMEEYGLDILLTVLITDDGEVSPAEGSSELRQFVLQWVLNTCVDKDGTHPRSSLLKPIWQVPPSLLCQVAFVYFSFYTRYMDHLTQWAQSMVIVYDDMGKAGYTWSLKSQDTEDFSYTKLKQCFQGLCEHPHTALAVRKTIQDLATRTDCSVNIWTDLLKDIPVTFNIDAS